MTKLELFKELAKPDQKGFSRPVHRKEFVGKFGSFQIYLIKFCFVFSISDIFSNDIRFLMEDVS